jgi:DNA replication protein DnaC
MLRHPTLERLESLGFRGMAKALREQLQNPEIETLAFEDRLGLLIDREATDRDDRQMSARLRRAKLRHNACIEDIDMRHPRGLNKAMVTKLSTGQWVREHLNLLIIGPTGVGKSYLACAFAQSACRGGFSAFYARLSRLLQDLAIAKADGRYARVMAGLAKTDVLVLDDFGLEKMNGEQRRDLLEIVEDRHGRRSTIVTSQVPLEHWHEAIGDPTLGDATLDRVVHNAYKIELKGGSMRKHQAQLT